MVSDLQEIYSTNAKNMKKSVIRELLKLTQKPGIISFAGGLPNPNYFPLETVNGICQDVVMKQGEVSLQYGATEGYTPLRESIAQRLKKFGA